MTDGKDLYDGFENNRLGIFVTVGWLVIDSFMRVHGKTSRLQNMITGASNFRVLVQREQFWLDCSFRAWTIGRT